MVGGERRSPCRGVASNIGIPCAMGNQEDDGAMTAAVVGGT